MMEARKQRWSLVLVTTAVAFLTAKTVGAQFGDIDAFSGYVPPNVVVLLDNSDSMNHHLWDDDFDPEKLYPGYCSWPTAPTIPGTSCPGNGNPGDLCPNNDHIEGANSPHLLHGSAIQTHTECSVTRTLYHDQTTTPRTRYSLNYLNWLFGVATAADLTDEPTNTRFRAAADTIIDVLQQVNPDSQDEKIRPGLAIFDGSAAVSGGNIKQPINDRNTQSVIAAINGTNPTAGGTPLSEALVDVGRYYAGTDGLGSYPGLGIPSPIDVSCRNNFVVVITDGEPSKDLNDHHGTAFMDTIGNIDNDSNECSSGPPSTCTDAPSTGREDGRPYINGGSDWLDDVARYLFITDLNPTLDGLQNVMTYTIGFVNDHPLLQEAATNGYGEHYTTNPTDASSLAQQLMEALLHIIERSTSFTSSIVPTMRTRFGDGLYTAYFIPSNTKPFWEGRLQAYRLAQDGSIKDASGNDAIDPTTGQFVEPRNPIWDAGLELKNNTSRSLYTTQFASRVDLSSSNVSRTDLGLDPSEIPSYSGYDSSGVGDPNDPLQVLDSITEALIRYVHGEDAFDDDMDSNRSELREAVLGDVFHSESVVVGPPSTLLSKEEGFGASSPAAPADPTFLEQFAQRDRVIYAAANDALLHAFDAGSYDGTDPNRLYTAGTGAERFGYVPGVLLDRIKYLPRNRPRTHYFMDGPLELADAWLGDGTGSDVTKEPGEWATVLIAGLRQGGAAYLALDVTDPAGGTPEHSPYPKLLWELTHAKLGETWSKPVIARVKMRGANASGDHCGSDDGDGDCREQWVAIFGGGYAADGDPNLGAYIADPSDPSWSNRSKAIFVVNLRTGAVLASVEFDATGIAGPSAMKYSIPSAPALLDLDLDGFTDVVYIGDLGGQLWKWDLSAVGEDTDFDGLIDNWPSGVFFRSDPETLSDGTLHYRSIFFPPSAAKSHGVLKLAFATGERTDLNYAGDDTADESNRLYVARDENPTGALAFAAMFDENDLTDITNLNSDPDPTDAGFYLKVQDAEKFVTESFIFAGQVITASYIPELTGVDICSRTGESSLYVFDLTSGVGFFDGSTANAGRLVSVGAGVAADPKVVLSASGDQLYVQTSTNRVVHMPAPPRDQPPVSFIYWKQNF
jgi:type IV pilus assembly protein PilY1